MLFTSQTISVANLAVFPRIWACVFVELRVCLKTYGLLVIGLVLIEICLFFGLVFRRFLITDFWLFFQIYLFVFAKQPGITANNVRQSQTFN